ncbi:MAG TPA: XRE family transcriptional regulator [Firmicutes bacterium]|nr:XRE family transcriptional regulator [Bacillota bacterium]
MLGGVNMDAMKRVGLNTRWYRYQKGLTQEKFSEITNFKMAYISVIESGNANLTCRNIDVIAKSLGIDVELLFSEKTANKAIDLPMRVYMYKK